MRLEKPTKMRIVFMGSPEFAVHSLHALLESGHDICAVVTVPDKPAGRGRKLRPSAVKVAAVANQIPVFQPEKLKDPQFINSLEELKADLFVVVAYRILPQVVFSIPSRGTINVHASLLPKYRGAAPINWALINGDSESGVTIIRIDKQVDTGNMLAQVRVPLDEQMDAGTLHDILAREGAQLLVQTIARLDSIKAEVQDNSRATRAPKIDRSLCHLQFDQPAGKVHNLVRGLAPYPAAFCYLDGMVLKIFKTRPVPDQSGEKPGTVAAVTKDSFFIACSEGQLEVREVQLQGKKRMSVRDFFNGYLLKSQCKLD